MSFKDDFVEALRSVKRDFFRETEDQSGQNAAESANTSKETTADVSQPENQLNSKVENVLPNSPLAQEDDVMEAFRKASAPDGDKIDDNSNSVVQQEKAPNYAAENDYSVQPPSTEDDRKYENQDTERPFVDFGGNVYDDDKTVISKNTVIRGSLETADSVRLLGQVLGDIDCKSNIVVAGKVRGNTSAANAYIFDAQVDGDVHCEDVITISNDAWVLGNLQAQQAEIDGKIKGNIDIRHMVSIGSSSSVLGNISTDELEIKRGAFVNGQIMMYSPSRDVLDRFDKFEE